MDYRTDNANTDLYQSFAGLPKIELHRHLEGTLRLSTLSEVARKHKLDLPGYDIEDIRPLVQISNGDKPHSAVYLSKFAILRSFYQSPEVIQRVAYEAVQDAAAEGTVYFEMRFTPMALAREKGFALADVSDWVIEAVDEARRKFKIDVRLIVSMNRNEDVSVGEQAVKIAIDRMDRGIVGVDIAGNESQFPGEEFAPLFREAREAGLSVTIHAGEWAGAESIRMAIEKFGAMRLGHGVRIVEDADLLRLARDQQIAFEVCPTSNVQSGVVGSFKAHPLRTMYQVGLLTTINTDNTSVGGINLIDEYVRVSQHLGFLMDDIKQHVLNAAHAAFLPPAERDKLVKRLTRVFQVEDKAVAASKP